MHYFLVCLLSIFFIGCDARVRDFGDMSVNPCETTHCKQHKDKTSICVIKCKDGLYAVESHKLKVSEDSKTYTTREN